MDVVISNCVLNLVPDKARAFAEMVRVIRPSGHFCISDVVSRGHLPESIRSSAELYAGCVAGALDQGEYLEKLRGAGFEAVEIVAERPIHLPAGLLPEGAQTPLYSVTVRGVRPPTIAPAASIPETSATGTLQIYEPAMCCSTGLCGPDPDEALVQFAADIEALAAEGVAIRRFNLAQEPAAFVAQPAVVAAVNSHGAGALPLVVKDGRVVSHGRYPSKAELAGLAAETPGSSQSIPRAAIVELE